MKELYYELYDNFSKILINSNPCKWENGKCLFNRETDTVNGCCNTCIHTTFAGCNIQSLACKSFLCEKAFYNLQPLDKAEWRELTDKMDENFPGLRNKMTYLQYSKLNEEK